MSLGRALRLALPLALALAGALAGAGEAAAASCSFDGPGSSWHIAGNWSCAQVPDGDDDVFIGPADSVNVSANAGAGSLTQTGGDLILSGNSTLAVTGAMTSGADIAVFGQVVIRGNGTVTVGGTFTKAGDTTMYVQNDGAQGSADLVLNGPGSVDEGTMCVARYDSSDPDLPNLFINNTFTITAESGSQPFSCSSAAAHIHVGSSGHLIKAGEADKTSFTAIDNDGTITAQAGTLYLLGGSSNAGGATSDGDYIANGGATLEFQGGSPPLIGPTGRFGGPGTIHVNSLGVTMDPGATLDPATLKLTGELFLQGTSAVTLPTLNMPGGRLNSTRPVTATAFSTTGGALENEFTLTVPSGGSFTKTTAGLLSIRNSGSGPSADLVLDADASLADGSICVARNDSSHPDQPNLHINQDFTIGAAAPFDAFGCSAQSLNIHLNGPSGTMSWEGTGSRLVRGGFETDGNFSVAAGQTISFDNAFAQTGGITEIAFGGILQASPTLSGGVLGGAGQVTGNLTNSSGKVRPGSSPGVLTVTGDYTQGAAGVLEVDVNGTTQGTQFDHLSVGGAATLAGTVAVVKGAGFDPQLSDTFQFLTSASRTGTFAALVGSLLAGGEGYVLDYPGSPSFGTRLTVTDTPGSVAQPSLTETYPASPVNHNTPDVKGTAPPGSTVALYASADCSGPPAAIGSAADFAAPGLPVSVSDNSSTTFRATATIGGGTSPCSATSVTYVEDSGQPEDVVVHEGTSQEYLDSLVTIPGSLIMTGLPTRPSLVLPNLQTVGGGISVSGNTAATVIDMASVETVTGSVDVTGNSQAGSIDMGSLVSVTGSVDVSGNTAATVIDMASVETVTGSVDVTGNSQAGSIDMGSLVSVTGSVDVSGNGAAATVTLGSLNDVGGNLTVESEGTGTFDPGPVSPDGDTTIDTDGYDAVAGTTATGATTVENTRGEATMAVQLPTGAFAAPVPFTISRIPPSALPPEQGAAAGGAAATVDPVAAYQLDFDVPTLNQDATLSFEIQMDGLDPATRDALLAAVNAGTATMATRGDAPGGTYQTFSLCAGTQVPTADGCVGVEKLDANGQPTTGTPARVRFTGVTGHFSTWAVAIVQPLSTAPPSGSSPPPQAKKRCRKGFKKIKGKCRKKKRKKR